MFEVEPPRKLPGMTKEIEGEPHSQMVVNNDKGTDLSETGTFVLTDIGNKNEVGLQPNASLSIDEPEENVKSNIKVERHMEVEFVEEDDDPLHPYRGESADQEDEASLNPKSPASTKEAGKTFVQRAIDQSFSETKSKSFYEPSSPQNQSSLNFSIPPQEDTYDIYGKHVASKLRKIASQNNTQRLLAEKIINDALFMAELEQLTLDHCNTMN